MVAPKHETFTKRRINATKHPRLKTNNMPSASSAAPRVARSVTFSATSMISHFTDQGCSWYSPEERNGFEAQMREDARRTSQLISSLSAGLADANDELDIVGLENCLSQRLAVQVVSRKRSHRRAIIFGQAFYNKIELARLSEQSSDWACNGARYRAKCLREDISRE